MKNKGTKNSLLRKLSKKRVLLACAAGALLFLALFIALRWYLERRAGRQYYGKPEALLPPSTAVMATWSNFSSFLHRFQSLQAIHQLQSDENVATLLLSDPSWRRLQKEKDKIRYKALTAMADDFVEKWLGQEVTVAIVPPMAPKETTTTSTARSGLLLIARTRIGFEENLAQLVAEMYPDLSLEKRVYRGHRIFRYNAPKTRNAFSYCRFGNTVILCFRSGDWKWLESIVDYKTLATHSKEKSMSLAMQPAFHDAWSSRSTIADGLNIFVSPATLAPAFKAYPGQMSKIESWKFWFDYADENLKNMQWGRISLDLDQGLKIQSFWKYVTPRATLSKQPSHALSYLSQLPSDAPLAIVAEAQKLRPVLVGLRDRMRNSDAYKKKVKRFERDWKKETDTDLYSDWLQPMGNEIGIVLTGFRNNLLFPTPAGHAWWQFADLETSRKMQQSIASGQLSNQSSKALALGQLQMHSAGKYLHLDLNESSLPSADSFSSSPLISGLLSNEILNQAWNGNPHPPVFCLYANLRTGYAHVDRLYKITSIWSKKVRKNVQAWTTILGVFQYMDYLCLTAVPEEQGVKVDLIIPVK